ncbi:hypothetical protein [Geminocystis herdmanii]|uniref:hypothetical protein n=1 Tax=Geminocystis herdmanii TaxID=669359 RepID=UPI00034C32E8|nr:hypothetical protein [Geminocystis herdmanii]
MTNKQLIFQEIEEIPEQKLAKILDLIRVFKSTIKLAENSYKPIWEIADEIINDIPDHVFDQLPSDGAENKDWIKNTV